MTLEFIEVENFQRHEKRRVDFDPLLTTIIGATDAGKSSLLRAIRWVTLNQPDGDAFIRHGSQGAVATLGVDGRTITRRRMTNGDNKYYLDGQEFSAFGRGVPDRISAVLQVDRINFVGQKEPDFWFSLPPGEVARQLNAIVDLGVIDNALEGIWRKVRHAQENVKTAQERLAEARTKREALEWVEQAERDLANVASAWETTDTISKRLASIDHHISEIEHYTAECDAATTEADVIRETGKAGAWCLKLESQISALSALIDDIERLEAGAAYAGDINPLSDALAQWQTASDRLARLESLIADIERLQTIVDAEPAGFDGIVAAAENVQRIEAELRRLSFAIVAIEDNLEAVKAAETDEKEAWDAIERETGGRCPICGTEISGQHAH